MEKAAARRKKGKETYRIGLDPQAAPTAPQAVARIFSRVMVMPAVEDVDGAKQLFIEQQSSDFVSEGQL